HDLLVIAEIFAEFGDQLLHFFNAVASAFDTPWCGDLYAKESAISPRVRKIRMNSGIAGNRFFRLAAEDLIDWKISRFCNQVVERKINPGHGHAGNPAKTVGQGGAIHLVPDQFYIERVLANQKAL